VGVQLHKFRKVSYLKEAAVRLTERLAE